MKRWIAGLLIGCLPLGGCVAGDGMLKPAPAIPENPESEFAAPFTPDASTGIQPMHNKTLRVALKDVVALTVSQNFDIRQAGLEESASEGRYESRIGRVFPALQPTGIFTTADGLVRNVDGNIFPAAFQSYQVFLFVDWVVNPGKAYYEIKASKSRLAATRLQKQAVIVSALREALAGYYDLLLAQAQVLAAQNNLNEAEEIHRVAAERLRTGMDIKARELQARARAAQRKRDLTEAMNRFYQASVSLAVTLRLDPTLTLIPQKEEYALVELVPDSLSVNTLLALALKHRPDLASMRSLVEAAGAERKAVLWGGIGPQLDTSYQIGGIGGRLVDQGESFAFGRQEFLQVGTNLRLGVDTFGNLKTARAVEKQAHLEVFRGMERIKGQVVSALQTRRTQSEIIPLAREEVRASEEVLRIARARLDAGTHPPIEIFEAESQLASARFRFAQAVIGYNKSQIDLLTALGLLPHAFSNPKTGSEDHSNATQPVNHDFPESGPENPDSGKSPHRNR